MYKLKIPTLLIITILSTTVLLGQKKLRTPAQLKKAKIFRSLQEANLNKKKVYILNLDNQKLQKKAEFSEHVRGMHRRAVVANLIENEA